MVRVVVTLRAIWYARRKAIYENSYQGPLSTHCFIDRFIADLGEPASKKSTERIPTGRLYPSWIPAPYGCAKINVDASTSKNSALASIAACWPRPQSHSLSQAPELRRGRRSTKMICQRRTPRSTSSCILASINWNGLGSQNRRSTRVKIGQGTYGAHLRAGHFAHDLHDLLSDGREPLAHSARRGIPPCRTTHAHHTSQRTLTLSKMDATS
jgi:hypothetical protein